MALLTWPAGVTTTRQRWCVGVTVAVVAACLAAGLWSVSPCAVLVIVALLVGAIGWHALMGWGVSGMRRLPWW